MLSFRLGGTDGVAVEARKWEGALAALGFSVRRIAGALEDESRSEDVVLAGLGLPGTELDGTTSPLPPVDPDALDAALDGTDLVVVENLLSLPLNLPAAAVVADRLVARGHRVLLHHHDMPWQRDRTSSTADFPPALPGAVHVTINDASRRQLRERRGIDATTIRNCFDLDAPLGDRARGRAVLKAEADDIVVLHPVRAISRKNIPAAVALCEGLAGAFPDRTVRYWLPGPAEEGYRAELDRVLAGVAADVVVHRDPSPSMPDAYAACDLVAFPSLWEGFGNPVIESVWAGRPLAVSRYPVLEELLALGFRFLDAADPAAVAAELRVPDLATRRANLALAREHHSLPALEAQLQAVLERAGWLP
jgi:glycosyltransferase involved in cell wall biosynthesis